MNFLWLNTQSEHEGSFTLFTARSKDLLSATVKIYRNKN